MNSDAHNLNAKITLGGCLRGDREDAERILFATGVTVNDFPNHLRNVYEVLINVMRDNKDLAPTPESISAVGGIDIGLLRNLEDSANGKSVDGVMASATAMISVADRLDAYKKITDAIANLDNEKMDTDTVRSKLMGELSRSRRADMQPADASSILERFKDSIGQEGNQPLPTYITWLSYVTNGGFRKRRLFGIAGPDKSRKTTLLRNILLSLVRVKPNNFNGYNYIPRMGVTAAILAFENDQETTIFDFVAMLAWERLWANGNGRRDAEIEFKGMHAHQLLNSELIMTAMDNNSIKRWPNALQEAIEWGIEMVADLSISVYDSNPQNGGIDNMDDMSRVVNMHLAYNSGNHNLVCIDYNGLVTTPGMSDYQGQTEIVSRELKFANTNDATVIALAQYSRGHQKDVNEGKAVKTVGTDNSPALERSVHNYFQVNYDESIGQVMNVKQVRARRSAGGMSKRMSKSFWIQPSSGSFISEITNASDVNALAVKG